MTLQMQDRAAITTQEHDQHWGQRGTAGAMIAGKLTFDNVSLTIGSVEILKNFSFELAAGEIACLLGQSGCGKTSLLRIAAGIQRPSSGRVLIDDDEVDGPNSFVPPERRNIGLVFQDSALFPHLSVIENVSFGLNALNRREASRVAQHALDRVGLANFSNSCPGSLSGGEQQRVALARAIVPRPQVMLMDEPFSGLDQRLREMVREETLALLRETRATCLLVTHDPVEAMDMADRIFLMRQGRLVQSGTSHELFNHPLDLEVARFFSDVNEIAGSVRGGAIETPLGTFPVKGYPEGAEVAVVLRPQAIRLASAGEGIEGYVRESRFLGDRTRCLVLFEGLDEAVEILLAGAAPGRGEIAHFRVDQALILTFNKSKPAII